MKKTIGMTILLCLAASGLSLGQGRRVLEIQAGYLDPKGTAAGFIFGGNYGISFEDRVDLTLGVSFFHKTYRRDTAVADTDYVSGVHENTVTRELEYSTSLLPLSANVVVHIPSFHPSVLWYAGGSLSYQFLFNTENNYEDGIKEKRNYSGFGWMARAGLEYMIGYHTSVTLEAFYNGCKVQGDKEKTEGLPVWGEVDVSGLGFRAGVRLGFN
jgi:hypothetical protein